MLFQRFQSRYRLLRLLSVCPQPSAAQESQEGVELRREYRLENLQDRFGSAGYLGEESRRRGRRTRLLFLTLTPAAFLLLSALRKGSLPSPFSGLLLCLGGVYCGLNLWILLLKYLKKDFEREVLFQLPLFLESLILVVETGMGVLPALEQVLQRRERLRQVDPVSELFRLVYGLSSRGLPLEQALDLVADHMTLRPLRHVLLHLDISANIGGELVPALRNLSDHAHNEWRLSVEGRVRRLENLVVFPVFVSVMGMIALIAAVPLVPLLGLQETLQHREPLPQQLLPGVQP